MKHSTSRFQIVCLLMLLLLGMLPAQPAGANDGAEAAWTQVVRQTKVLPVLRPSYIPAKFASITPDWKVWNTPLASGQQQDVYVTYLNQDARLEIVAVTSMTDRSAPDDAQLTTVPFRGGQARQAVSGSSGKETYASLFWREGGAKVSRGGNFPDNTADYTVVGYNVPLSEVLKVANSLASVGALPAGGNVLIQNEMATATAPQAAPAPRTGPAVATASARADYDVEGGHFYSQASGQDSTSLGFVIADEGRDSRGQNVKFWSEFQRLGGVDVLGYPASRRFMWNGFMCQATQRVILQWRPDVGQVYFVNVMDLMTEAGLDEYLFVRRQVPRPANYGPSEQGMSFAQITKKRWALLDANPAIRAKYFSVSDALNLHGLPTAPVQDMGNVYVLRAQRVVIQQWKVNTPWARAGEVTVALGGDLAKETGLLDAVDKNADTPQQAPAPAPGPAPMPSPVIFTGIVTEDYATIRAEPTFNSEALGRVTQGQRVQIAQTVVGAVVNGHSDLWYKHASGGYSSALFINPEGTTGAMQLVALVDARRLEFYQGNILLKRWVVNVGRPDWETPRGSYRITWKIASQDMQGGTGAEYYFQPAVPWIMYFTNYGHAIHGNYWSNSFGLNTSHGCVSMPTSYAKWLYDRVPTGTPLLIK